MLLAESTAAIVVALAAVSLPLLLIAVLLMAFLPTWIQAVASGTPVMILDLIGMKLRRTDVKAVVRALIVARQGGVAISPAEMEKAWIQGANVEKVTRAIVQAGKENTDITFQEVVDAELEDRLTDLLRPRGIAELEEAAAL